MWTEKTVPATRSSLQVSRKAVSLLGGSPINENMAIHNHIVNHLFKLSHQQYNILSTNIITYNTNPTVSSSVMNRDITIYLSL